MTYSFILFRRIFYRAVTYLILLLTLLICLCIGLANDIPLRLNLTGSMPLGVYWVTHTQLRIGEWVAVCLPDNLAQFGLQRGYLHAGDCSTGAEPLPKKVVGIAGDRIVLGASSVRVNDTPLLHSATLPNDTLQRSFPAIPRGVYTLSSQQVWLFGVGSARSWDSRYFGAVDVSCINGVAKPLIIFNGSQSK